MGDYTARCAVSGLPLWGQKAVGIGLAVSKWNSLHCGAITPTHLYSLATLPIIGKHDGYGFIDNIENPEIEKMSCEVWSKKNPTFRFFHSWPSVTVKTYDNHDETRKLTFALIHYDVWQWMMLNSRHTVSEIIAQYKERYLPKIDKYHEDSKYMNDSEIRFHRGLDTHRLNLHWDEPLFMFFHFLKDIGSFPDVVRDLSESIILSGNLDHVSVLAELFVATWALSDTDRFWQPSSTCGDQYGEITRTKIKFAENTTRILKDMYKNQQKRREE